MSKLDDQLEQLQKRKAKVEIYKSAKGSILAKSEKYKDISEEVKSEIHAFIDSKIQIIENGEVEQPTEAFTDNEVKILKKMAGRVIEREKDPEPVKKSTHKPQQKQKPKQPVADIDPLSFALKYRPYGGKTVLVDNKHRGQCVGMEAPHLLIKMEENGQTIKVPPANVGFA